MNTGQEFERFSDRCIDRYKLAFLEGLDNFESGFYNQTSEILKKGVYTHEETMRETLSKMQKSDKNQ